MAPKKSLPEYIIRMNKYAIAIGVCACLIALAIESAAHAEAWPNQAIGPVVQAASNLPAPVIVQHAGTFNGVRVGYSSTVEAIDVPTADGKGGARVVSFAYVRNDDLGSSKRAVVFLFNGGPITASIWVHLGVFGPKRVEAPSDLQAGIDAFRLIDNPLSPLDVADLVFIDPADTGFSQRLPGTPEGTYHSVQADGQQVAGFIQRWLGNHGRLGSPVYIMGESYGTVRAPMVIGQLAAMPKPVLVDGVFLFGQAVNIVEYSQRPNNIISYAVSLPTLAAIAWYHNKVEQSGRTFDQFIRQAQRYSATEYLTALFQGADLSGGERRVVAQRLEQFTGVPASYYVAHGLRITKEEFRLELLKDRRLLLGRNDARYTALVTDKGGAPDPSDVIALASEHLWKSYMASDLGVKWDLPYKPMAQVKSLEEWGWDGSSPFNSWPYGEPITRSMALNPKFRVLIGNGYYDTQTTIGAADYLRTQSGWPANRVALRFYQGGHMAYSVNSAAAQISNDLRKLVTGAPLPTVQQGEQ
jgi:carboxypeptidase C (cathepsin A)